MILGDKIGKFGESTTTCGGIKHRLAEEIGFSHNAGGDGEFVDGDVEFCVGGREVEFFEAGAPAWIVVAAGDDTKGEVVDKLSWSWGKGAFEEFVHGMLEGV